VGGLWLIEVLTGSAIVTPSARDHNRVGVSVVFQPFFQEKRCRHLRNSRTRTSIRKNTLPPSVMTLLRLLLTSPIVPRGVAIMPLTDMIMLVWEFDLRTAYTCMNIEATDSIYLFKLYTQGLEER
jgi:hypothetical protein